MRAPVGPYVGQTQPIGRGVGRVQPHVQPRARVAPFVHGIVHQPGVAAHRDAAPRRAEIGLGRDGVLPVAEAVGDVRQKLDQRHAQVGRVALCPVGHQAGQPVEHQPPKAGVVFGQVVDLRRRQRLRWADLPRLAVEVGRTFDLERKINRRQLRIETIQPRRVGARTSQMQGVGGEVARLVHRDDQHLRRGGLHRDLRRGHVPDALASLDADVLRLERGQPGGFQEVDEQRALALIQRQRFAVQDFQEVDAVQAGFGLDGFAPFFVTAEVDHGSLLAFTVQTPPRVAAGCG